MPLAFSSTNPNLNYAVNRLNQMLSKANGSITDIIHGIGSTAASAQVERAVKWMVDKASNNYITYSQSNRHLLDTTGTSYDCSSFVITAFYAAGFPVSSASTTRDMVDVFVAAGFTWHPGAYLPASSLQRGDILVKQFEPNGHTQVYIGDNQDVNCGGTPANVTTHSPDNWGRGGWDGYLRYGK